MQGVSKVGNHLTTGKTEQNNSGPLGPRETYSLDRAFKSVKKIFWGRKHRKNRSGHQHDVLMYLKDLPERCIQSNLGVFCLT